MTGWIKVATLRRRDLQQLDRLAVRNRPTDPLGRVEIDVGLVRIGIAQDVGFAALRDQITRLEIAKGDRRGVGRDVGHILAFNHRVTEQRIRLASQQTRLPDKGTVAGLELADLRQRRRIHHPHRTLAIRRTQRMDQIEQLVLRVGRREIRRSAHRHILQLAKGACRVGSGCNGVALLYLAYPSS